MVKEYKPNNSTGDWLQRRKKNKPSHLQIGHSFWPLGSFIYKPCRRELQLKCGVLTFDLEKNDNHDQRVQGYKIEKRLADAKTKKMGRHTSWLDTQSDM